MSDKNKTPHPLRAIGLLMVALMLFATLDATSKTLTQRYPVPLIAWARYCVHLILMTVLLAPSFGRRLVATLSLGLQVVRGLLLLGVTAFMMAGFSTLPLAEALALVFTSPLLVVFLAGPFLGERVPRIAWFSAALGFAGVLLIARPGGELHGAGVAFVLSAALCYALYQLLTRKLSASESSVALLYYTALMGTLGSSIALPFFWRGPAPDLLTWLQFLSLGIYGGVGHFLMIRAFALAPASVLSPFLYVQLIWQTLAGWLVFDHLPDGWAILGGLLIVASGVAIVWHQTRRGRR